MKNSLCPNNGYDGKMLAIAFEGMSVIFMNYYKWLPSCCFLVNALTRECIKLKGTGILGSEHGYTSRAEDSLALHLLAAKPQLSNHS